MRVIAAMVSVPLLLACEGHILGRDGTAPPPGGLTTPGSAGSTGMAGGPGSSPPLTAGPTDDELRAKDPELFDIAVQYFPGQAALAGKKRLFRLTRDQLDITTRTLLPKQFGDSALTTLPRDPLQTNYEYADILTFSAASFTPLTKWVEAMTTKVKDDPKSIIDCSGEQDSASCLETKGKDFVRRAFRGVVSDEALERFAKFYSSSATSVGVPQATADLVDVTLTSPSYLFREEVQTEVDGRLKTAQLLQNLSYTLADAPPEKVGLSMPAAGAIDAAALQAAVDQVMATPEARAKLLRFFTSWLEVKAPAEFDLAPSVYPEFTAEVAQAVVQDTQRFLSEQLGTALPKLSDVTEAATALISAPSAFLYDQKSAPADGHLALDPAQRLGIFSQPAVIASHSGPTTTRLVKRGVFFTRKVMCLPLGQPPADVNTTLPADVMGTERERVEAATTPARCLGCHSFINPFGFMQENYDATGRYRTMDAGKPINAAVTIDFLDEGPLTASTPGEALRGLTRSLRFQQCFARQVFRFYTGRDETAEDDPLLRQLFFEFASNNSQNIVGMLSQLANAPAFNNRREAP